MSVATRSLIASSSRVSALRSSTQRSLAQWMSSRRVHVMRPLPYPVEKGVGKFLPPQALSTVVEWQKGLLERLNDLVRDTELANQSVVQTIVSTALSEEHALSFNYASLALNNSFFLDNLKPTETNHEHLINVNLGNSIRQQFGSIEQFQSTFSAAATGITSSGWIWLVTDGNRRLAVLPTFGAGTLLIKSRRLMAPRGGPDDLGSVNVARGQISPQDGSANASARSALPPFSDGPQNQVRSSPTSGINSTAPPLNPQTPSRAMHSTQIRTNTPTPTPTPPSIFGTEDANMTPMSDEPVNIHHKLFADMGKTLYPLLCLSVHEHAWMSAGLGVWGKEEYLRRFWSVVDWEKVSASFDRVTRAQAL